MSSRFPLTFIGTPRSTQMPWFDRLTTNGRTGYAKAS